MASLLIIDDEQAWLKNAARYLTHAGHTVRTAETLAEGLAAMSEETPDAVVLDYRLPDGTGLDFIRRVRNSDAATRILLVTGHGSIDLAVEAMKAGANDLLTKPVSLGELNSRLQQIARAAQEAGRLDYFETRERGSAGALVGNAPVMQELRQRIARIAAIDGEGMLPPVLITGETGVGKEMVARACHFQSPRASRPFVELNCAAIPGPLLESMLFGHERGAFTDAKERRMGLLEAADGGTLFLDEIGEMDPGLQAKLLKVLEDGRFRRLGAVQERQLALRVVAATNQDLERRVADGHFRADLYYRLRVLTLDVPPLRDRAGDAVHLAEHFCAGFAARYRRPGLHLGAAAREALQTHHWPGNVRELRNVIEQAVLLTQAEELAPGDLMLPGVRPASAATPAPPDHPMAAAEGSALDQMERTALRQALMEASGNVSQAARALGISRDTLRYRMDKHGL